MKDGKHMINIVCPKCRVDNRIMEEISDKDSISTRKCQIIGCDNYIYYRTKWTVLAEVTIYKLQEFKP